MGRLRKKRRKHQIRVKQKKKAKRAKLRQASGLINSKKIK